jgi:hypothetical protein
MFPTTAPAVAPQVLDEAHMPLHPDLPLMDHRGPTTGDAYVKHFRFTSSPSSPLSTVIETDIAWVAVQVLWRLVQLPDQRLLPHVPGVALPQLRILHELDFAHDLHRLRM